MVTKKIKIAKDTPAEGGNIEYPLCKLPSKELIA